MDIQSAQDGEKYAQTVVVIDRLMRMHESVAGSSLRVIPALGKDRNSVGHTHTVYTWYTLFNYIYKTPYVNYPAHPWRGVRGAAAGSPLLNIKMCFIQAQLCQRGLELRTGGTARAEAVLRRNSQVSRALRSQEYACAVRAAFSPTERRSSGCS